MPPKNKKSTTKGTVVTAPANASTPSQQPGPWQTPKPELKGFVDGLDKKHIYIAHIDRHPRKVKRNIFMVPIAMNVVVAFLLAWRIKYVAPYYVALMLTFLRQDSPTNMDTANTPFFEALNAVFARTGTLFLDFCIFRFLAPWPLDFFVGDTSPAYWRSAIGFRDVEIVVRRSRRWDELLPEGWMTKQEDDDSEAAAVYRDRILPAVDKKWIRAKTGYLMMDKSWDLDFLAMTVAENMVTAGENEIKDFEKTVFAYSDAAGAGWMAWPLWKLDEGADEERRQKIVLFKDKLTAMGKESLFFRWIEIVQFESTQAGGFTPERQQKAMAKAKKLFEDEGVDFEKFWEEVGGMEGMPGMEQTP